MRQDRAEMNHIIAEIERVLRQAKRPLLASEIAAQVEPQKEGLLWRVRDRLKVMMNVKVSQRDGVKYYEWEERL